MPNPEEAPHLPDIEEFANIANHLQNADPATLLLLRSLVNHEIQRRCTEFFTKEVLENKLNAFEETDIASQVLRLKKDAIDVQLLVHSKKKAELIAAHGPFQHYREATCRIVASDLLDFSRKLN